MRCPYCKNTLYRGPKRVYETLIDHVMDPNAEDLPERRTFVCKCSPDMFWDQYGDVYRHERKAVNALVENQLNLGGKNESL